MRPYRDVLTVVPYAVLNTHWPVHHNPFTMKYCPACKMRMPSDAATCTRCGGALRTIGGGAAPAPGGAAAVPSGDDAALSLQLAGLQHAVQASRRRMIALGALAAALILFLLLLMTWLHFRHVFQYAEITDVVIEPVSGQPGIARVAFHRRGPGKVEFTRTAGAQSESLVDHGGELGAATATSNDFEWGTDGQTDYTIVIRFRSGWGLVEKNWSP